MRLIPVVMALVAAGTVAAGPTPSPATPASPLVAAQTSDDPFAGAWAEEAMSRAVRWPREALDAGDLVEADRRLEKLVGDAGSDAGERSRLLTAYALEIMTHFSDKGDPVPYLRRAAGEARLGFAPDSRMLAMSLSTWAEAEIQRRGAETSPEAEAALVEALDIRRTRLGPGHAETLVAATTLGKLRGDPARTGGDPARIAEASKLFEGLMSADRTGPDEPLDHLFLEWMGMLIANAQPDAACDVLARLPEVGKRLNLNLPMIANYAGRELRDAGYVVQAAGLTGPPARGRIPTLAELEASLNGPWVCGT